MKRIIITLSSLLLLYFAACSDDVKRFKRNPSVIDFSDSIEYDCPEKLAFESSTIYMGLINSNLDIDEAFDQLVLLSSSSSAAALIESRDEFERQIGNTIYFMRKNGDSIEKYEFAETIYDTSDSAYIERIQFHHSGAKYYFRQDFIRENDRWKIRGDNIVNPFSIKKKFLNWQMFRLFRNE